MSALRSHATNKAVSFRKRNDGGATAQYDDSNNSTVPCATKESKEMRYFDVKCPHCGTMNKHLYLEETNGWMICQNCGKDYKAADFVEVEKIPKYSGKQLARVGAKY